MRLISLARFKFGLLWDGKLPRINWRLLFDAVVFVVIFFGVIALQQYIGRNIKLADENARIVVKADKAEAVMLACLNNRPILASDNTVIFCEAITSNL